MEITIEEIQKKFESLPEDLKWAIVESDVDEKIIEIGKANNLTVEQMGQLSLETHMVMFGITLPSKFEESLKKSLNLSEEKIRIIVNAVNERILKNIREKIMLLHNKPDHTNETIDDINNKTEDHKEIFKSAGITILPKKEKEGVLKEINKNKSIAEHKLSNVYQKPSTTTEHSLNNITQNNTSNKYGNKTDPYREIPE